MKDKKGGGILDGDDGAAEILSWVGKSRKLDEKRQAEKEKALRLARALEEQVSTAFFFGYTVMRNVLFSNLSLF